MEQEENPSTSSPFWLPKTTTNQHRLRRTYSLFLTSTTFIILLIITSLIITLIVVPTLHSFTSKILKPQTIKNSWDYLNLILVLFAVVCGFLTKNDTNETQTPRDNNENPETPRFWYEHPNRSFNRLRSVGSYPDLRLVTDNEQYRFYDDTNVQFRYRFPRFEDEDELRRETVNSGDVFRPNFRRTEVKSPVDSRIEDNGRNFERMYQVETIEKTGKDDSVAENLQPPPLKPVSAVRKKKNRSASTENVSSVTSAEFFSSPVLQPELNSLPLPAVRKKKSRSVSTENAAMITSAEFFSSPVPVPELNPLPLPAARRKKTRSASAEYVSTVNSAEFSSFPVPELNPSMPSEVTRMKGVRRNVNRTYQSEMNEKIEDNFVAEDSSSVTLSPPLLAERKTGIHVKKKRVNATKEFLISLRGKKKKQRQKSVENFETIPNPQPPSIVSQPPPPPPPPPPSVFHNLFTSNKSKHKKHYLVPMATHKPQLPNKRENFQSNYKLNDNVVITGNESPLIPIPPPPPPPPFKLPAWKFRVQGDFVRVDSIGSSRSGSPDSSDEVVESPITSPYAPNGEDHATETSNASAPSLFCPSPDVDTKAQNFIQNFRAGLRMAKMNSMKEKQGIGRSNLGPLPHP